MKFLPLSQAFERYMPDLRRLLQEFTLDSLYLVQPKPGILDTKKLYFQHTAVDLSLIQQTDLALKLADFLGLDHEVVQLDVRESYSPGFWQANFAKQLSVTHSSAEEIEVFLQELDALNTHETAVETTDALVTTKRSMP